MSGNRVQRQRDAATVAASLWESTPAAGEHPYLTASGIEADGIRQRGGRLVVPMRDTAGELWNLQFIGAGGRTKYLHGGRVFGLLHLIGSEGDSLHVAEDYATAWRIHAHTKEAVAVAFELHNLRPVALALRASHPGARITVWLPESPQGARSGSLGHRGGITAATAAAKAVGGAVAILEGGQS